MKFTCPYCLEVYSPRRVRRICSICGCEYVPTLKDSLLPRTGRMSHCNVKGCNGNCTILKCAYCAHTLPADIMAFKKNVYFPVVSADMTGKTTYLTTMLEEARQNRSLGLELHAMNAETRLYHMGNVENLYEKHTFVADTCFSDMTPMQWKILDHNNEKRSGTPTYGLTIFDSTSEYLDYMMPIYTRGIAGSKMIMLLLDPTQLAGVRAQMTKCEIEKLRFFGKNTSREDTIEYIENLIRYLRAICSIRSCDKIQVPVAVVLGKIDTIVKYLRHAQVLTPSGHAAKGKFIQTEADIIHNEIESWLNACGESLTQIFNANCKTWRYFGVSSFGSMPNDRYTVNEIKPLRVLDPFIWDLALEGIIETVR